MTSSRLCTFCESLHPSTKGMKRFMYYVKFIFVSSTHLVLILNCFCFLNNNLVFFYKKVTAVEHDKCAKAYLWGIMPRDFIYQTDKLCFLRGVTTLSFALNK